MSKTCEFVSAVKATVGRGSWYRKEILSWRRASSLSGFSDQNVLKYEGNSVLNQGFTVAISLLMICLIPNIYSIAYYLLVYELLSMGKAFLALYFIIEIHLSCPFSRIWLHKNNNIETVFDSFILPFCQVHIEVIALVYYFHVIRLNVCSLLNLLGQFATITWTRQ